MLVNEGHNVAVLTGGEQMTKAMQDEVLKRFRDNKHKVLVTTDILSRGIDVPNVSMVVRQSGAPVLVVAADGGLFVQCVPFVIFFLCVPFVTPHQHGTARR